MTSNNSEKSGFDRDFLERVIESINPIAIIGRYTNLKKSGARYKGLCPFHKEKTPSFTVDPDKGLFYCFGCGKGGDIFTFLMEREGLSFVESVEYLAKEAGIPVPKRRKVSTEVSAMQEAIEEAHRFYKKLLQSDDGKKGIEYLIGRGIEKKNIREFGFGWAKNSWDELTRYIQRRNLDPKVFEKVGLIIKHAETGNYYDRFRNGIVIPIHNSGGRLIAFAVRSLDDGESPKYINSPDSALYHKSRVLFGLDKARKSIRQLGYAVLVEGYFDVLSLWNAGVENAIASCGTAFTAEHANIIGRFCDTAVVFYDGDSAGLSATYRAMEPLLRQELMVKIARPPKNMDPDDVARKWDSKDVKKLVESAPDWFDFSVETAKQSGLWDSVEGKIRFADRIAPYVAALGKSLAASLYRKKLGEILGVGDREIAARISKKNRQIFSAVQDESRLSDSTKTGLPPDAYAEIDLLAAIIANPTLCENVVESDEVVLYGGALKCIADEVEKTGECSVAILADVLEKRAMSYLTKRLLDMKNTPSYADVREIISLIKRKRMEIKLESLRINLRKAEKQSNNESTTSIIKEISAIKRKILSLSDEHNYKEHK